MKNTKNRVAIALLFSGVVMAAEGSSSLADDESFVAAASTITQVIRNASESSVASILRAVDRERAQNGKLPASRLDRGGLSEEQVDRANREQAAKDAKNKAGSGSFLYSALPGGRKK